MKKLGIIIVVLLVIITALGIGLQLFLTKGLATMLNRNVFPSVKSTYGLDMSVQDASVNLLKGQVTLKGFTVRNLAGYTEPYLLTFDKCYLEIEMLSLLSRNPVVIKMAEAKGATLIIERNKAQTFNVKELADSLKQESAATSKQQTTAQRKDTPQSAQPETKASKPVPVHIRRIAVDALVRYIDPDHKKPYDMNLRLTGSDLFTVPAKGQPNSLLVLRGSLSHDSKSIETDLNAILEPLVDPQRPSFNIAGSVMNIGPEFLENLLKKNNVESGAFSIKPSISCENGALTGSRIELVFKDLKIYGTEIGDTPLKLPLTGTIDRPMIDLTGALQSLFTDQSLKIGKTVGIRKLRKELGLGTNSTPREMLMSGLTNNVKEISDNPAVQQLIEQVVPGGQSADGTGTNSTTAASASDALVDQLGKNVKEIGDNEAVKDSLKSIGNSLFGK